VTINIATDLKGSWIAWIGVGLLTLAAAVVAVAAQRSTSAGARSGEDSTESANEQRSNVIFGNRTDQLGIGNTWAGRDIHYHSPALRAIGISSAIVWLTAATGLVAGAVLFRGNAATGPGPSEAIPPTIVVKTPAVPVSSGKISLTGQTHYYYPEKGVLPKAEPPEYSNHDSHCVPWADWARSVKAAPTGNYFRVDALASTSAPITILTAKFQVYSKHEIVGHDRIQCEYGFGGFGGTTLYPDLDHPNRPVPMDTNDDGKPDSTLPGGFFVVDPNKAEPLNIVIKGTNGQVYEYSVTFDIVENGTRKTVSFGSQQQPLLLAFDNDNNPDRANNPAANYYDWDFNTRDWAPAPAI
jgi:hypothetical protein